jgi:hypothetical protein
VRQDFDSARLGELDRIRRQIEHDLTQTRLVAQQSRRQVRVQFRADIQTLFKRLRFDDADRVVDQRRRRERRGLEFELAGIEF